jgi:hypothetical protein
MADPGAASGATISSQGRLPCSPLAHRRPRDREGGLSHLRAQGPVGTLLTQEVDASFPRLLGRTLEESGPLEHFELCVHRAVAWRVAEKFGEVLDADDAVATRDRGSYLDSVLGATEEAAGAGAHTCFRFDVWSGQYDLRNVDQGSLKNTLGLMIAAGEVHALPARTPWPMHQALRELYEDLGRRGLRRALDLELVFTPSPTVGLAVRGADEAFRALVREGVVVAEGAQLDACWLVERDAVVASRRALMTLEPQLVQLLQRAGSRWAALAETVSKKCAAAAASPDAILASAAV